MFPFTKAAASCIGRPTAVTTIITIRDLDVAFRIIEICSLMCPISVDAKLSMMEISTNSFREGQGRGFGLSFPHPLALLPQAPTLHPQLYID